MNLNEAVLKPYIPSIPLIPSLFSSSPPAHSRICTAFQAAPLRSWSPLTKRARPCADGRDRGRIRPTSTSNCPVASSGIGKMVLLAVIDDLDARRASTGFRGLPRERCSRFGLDHNRFAVSAQDRHADAGRHDGQLRLVEDFACFLDDLVLLLVVAILGDGGVMGENIEGDLVRENLAFERLARRVGARPANRARPWPARRRRLRFGRWRR